MNQLTPLKKVYYLSMLNCTIDLGYVELMGILTYILILSQYYK